MPRPIPAHPGLPLAAAAVALLLVALATTGGHTAQRAQHVDMHREASQGLEWVLRGKVVAGATPRPASGTVILHPDRSRCEWSTQTDANGAFARNCFDLGPGDRLRLAVIRVSGYEDDVREVGIPADVNELEPLLIQLTPVTPATRAPTPEGALGWTPILGHAHGIGGPLAGAMVSVSSERSPWWSPVVTDGAGAFEVWSPAGKRSDRIRVQIEATGYATWTGSRPLDLGLHVEAHLVPLNRIFLPMLTRRK